MYRCELCNAVSDRGQSRLTHVIPRRLTQTMRQFNEQTKFVDEFTVERTEIERELSVCRACKKQLDKGTGIGELIKLQNV